jgi:hypothetical protein
MVSGDEAGGDSEASSSWNQKTNTCREREFLKCVGEVDDAVRMSRTDEVAEWVGDLNWGAVQRY